MPVNFCFYLKLYYHKLRNALFCFVNNCCWKNLCALNGSYCWSFSFARRVIPKLGVLGRDCTFQKRSNLSNLSSAKALDRCSQLLPAPQRRKGKIEQMVERFTPFNPVTAPLAGFHHDLECNVVKLYVWLHYGLKLAVLQSMLGIS